MVVGLRLEMKVKKIATGSLGGLFSEWRKMRK